MAQPGKLSWRKRLLFGSAAAAMGLALVVMALELVLRAAGYGRFGLDTAGAVERWPVHEMGRMGGNMPPGVWRLRHLDFDVQYAVNSRGFRDREVTPRRAGEWRIGLLGDSYTCGHGVELEQRFGNVWQNGLTAQTRQPVSVWNCSAGNSGTAHQADFLAGLGREFDFDEIIDVFCAENDLDDNEHWYQREGMPQDRPENGRNWLRTHSRLACFLYFQGTRALVSRRPSGEFSAEHLLGIWPWTQRALNELKAAVGDRPLTIWYLPARPEWDDAQWNVLVERYGAQASARHIVRERLSAWAREQHVEFVDLTAYLQQSVPQAVYFPIDPHWTPLGHRLVGEGLAANPCSAYCRRRQTVNPEQ